MHRVLFDPGRAALWERFVASARQGVKAFYQWTPSDGLSCGSARPAHQHTMPTLMLCLDGQLRVTGRHSVDLGAGDLLLIEPGCWHEHPPLRPGTNFFALGFLAGRCDMKFCGDGHRLWGAVPDEPCRQQMEALMFAPDAAERLRLVDELLGGIAEQPIAAVDWLQPGVHGMAEWLWLHLHERVDGRAMLAHAGLSRSTGFRLFQRFFGHSPRRELMALRAELAHHLVRRGFMPGDVARRCGLSGASEVRQLLVRHPPTSRPRLRPRSDQV
jgi:AraC-like DNA-binding protein